MKEMTQRQREVLGFMRGFSEKHGAPPTVREIAERAHDHGALVVVDAAQ